jgi:methyl-accepting chemotaxis protein
MDQVTHQNAASSEELSSTAEELAAQAQELSSMVSRFRLGDEREVRRPVAPRDTAMRRPQLESSAGPGLLASNGGHLILFADDAELRDF